MLVKYKNDYEKIAMGLLSFIPDLKDVGHLKTELKMYTEDDSHALYLYKQGHDFVGVIGIELSDDFVLVRHLSFSPNFRDQATAFAALTELTQLFPDKKMMGALEHASLIAAFNKFRKEDDHGTDTRAE
ncbi:N-acetyltransferase [Lacticaseibacillus chiayiensis]|uniref:N-acetyltransferase n=1 Tax=Lacticaseibacillus chiayiensis TaxID=2100821 RepID=UPI001012B95E|nr:N-acetyltransferase [Lacticaseibacillus chiayiensis]RXT58659.1 N-acetyltransferase [Lacticaseibacillus chiayiensis]